MTPFESALLEAVKNAPSLIILFLWILAERKQREELTKKLDERTTAHITTLERVKGLGDE